MTRVPPSGLKCSKGHLAVIPVVGDWYRCTQHHAVHAGSGNYSDLYATDRARRAPKGLKCSKGHPAVIPVVGDWYRCTQHHAVHAEG